MKIDSYQVDLPKILFTFLLTFQGKFQISCVVRNNYVKYMIMGFIFCKNYNEFVGSFGGPIVHMQKTPPNMGRMGCAC